MADKNSQLLDISDKIAWMFPTPVIGFQWPDTEKLNKDLEKVIRAKKGQDESLQLSNAGGWQSKEDLLNWKEPCTETLKGMFNRMLMSVVSAMHDPNQPLGKPRFRMDCWANVNDHGNYNVIHSHPNSLWSSVYYVNRGEPDPNVEYGGKLEILDPRAAASYIQIPGDDQNKRCIVDNIPGFMIMFPSWVKHMVHPHFGKGGRISIALNALPAPKDQG